MINFDEFIKRYQDRLKAVAEANVLNKGVVFDALVAAGITRLTIDFDGEGDSGQLNTIAAYAGDTQAALPATSVTLHRAPWNSTVLTTHTETLEEAIKTLCCDYLEEKHDGWENNDGAFGAFEFDVENRAVSLEFNARFVDTTAYEHTF